MAKKSAKKSKDIRLNAIEANICPFEIVPPGKTIELTLQTPADAKSVQGAIRLKNGFDWTSIHINLRKRGRLIRLELSDCHVGTFDLVVSELLGPNGERLVDEYHLPFSVISIAGTVASNLRVEHVTRVRIGELHTSRLSHGHADEGDFVDVIKAVDRKTGAPCELAFDNRAKRVDFNKLIDQLAKRRAEKFGRINESLYELIDKCPAKKVFPVVVWPRITVPPAPYEKCTDGEMTEPPEAECEVLNSLREPIANLKAAMRRTEIRVAKESSKNNSVPCVRATATASQIRALANEEHVGAIFFDDHSATVDLGNSIAIARSNRAHILGFDGTGTRAAVWEGGPDVLTNLAFSGQYLSSPTTTDHARLTSSVVKNTEPGQPHGHAPDCDLYSANSYGTDALTWAVSDQHCTVVSQSFHRTEEAQRSGMQSDDILKDWLVLRWPYPTIIQAAGNFVAGDSDNIASIEDEYVNHKGYNSLSIGNHNDLATAMDGSSVWRNPDSLHGDRELPELAANGTAVSSNGLTKTGTSFAAPAVAGVTALLQEVAPGLRTWPEGCRAILLASASRSPSWKGWWQTIIDGYDGIDGSGALDALVGITIAGQRRSRNAASTRYGWDVGTLRSEDFAESKLSTFRYYIFVPRRLWFRKVKVALAWDSAVGVSLRTLSLNSTLSVDLDLIVRDSHGNQVAASSSFDNSYEIAEFYPAEGETYEVIIRRWSGQDSVWYGLAWAVTGSEHSIVVSERNENVYLPGRLPGG